MREAERGCFGIGFVGSILYGKLPEVIRRYRAAWPGVAVALMELTSLERTAALKEGRIDVGFGRILHDASAESGVILELIQDTYREDGIAFGK